MQMEFENISLEFQLNDDTCGRLLYYGFRTFRPLNSIFFNITNLFVNEKGKLGKSEARNFRDVFNCLFLKEIYCFPDQVFYNII